MKKSLVAAAALLVASLATSAFAQSQLTNSGRIMSDTQVFASVNGGGSSLSHAESRSTSTANGSIVANGGKVGLTGDVAGVSDLSAYNVSTGSGVGEAGGRVWSDARVNGAAFGAIPTGTIQIAADVDGGMRDPGRNGSDVTVLATTGRDGFVQSLYNGGFAVNGLISTGSVPGGTKVEGNVQGTTYQHSEVVAGGITFSGGTPPGQAAAVRFGQSGVEVNFTGSFIDPVH